MSCLLTLAVMSQDPCCCLLVHSAPAHQPDHVAAQLQPITMQLHRHLRV
jgi:hypothetical protein